MFNWLTKNKISSIDREASLDRKLVLDSYNKEISQIPDSLREILGHEPSKKEIENKTEEYNKGRGEIEQIESLYIRIKEKHKGDTKRLLEYARRHAEYWDCALSVIHKANIFSAGAGDEEDYTTMKKWQDEMKKIVKGFEIELS